MDTTEVRYQNATLVGLVLLLVGSSIVMHLFKVPMIMGDVAASVGMAQESGANLMSAFTLPGIFLAIPAGMIASRFGSKTTIVIATCCVALGSLVGSFAATGNMLLVSRVVEGIGYILISIAGPLLVVQYVEPARIGFVMGLWAIWMSVGQIVAFNLTPALFASMSWNSIWRIYAGWTLILTFVLIFAIKKPEGLDAAQESAPGGEAVSVGALFANKNYLLGVVSFFAFNWLLLTHLTFLPAFMGTTGVITGAGAAFAGSFTMICALLGSPILGRMSDSIGRKNIYIAALIAAGIGLALPFTGSAAMVYVGSAFMGFLGLAAPGMILGAVPGLVNNPKAEGLAMGILFTFVNLGQFLATAVFPRLIAALGGSFLSAALVLEIMAAIGVVTGVMIKFKR